MPLGWARLLRDRPGTQQTLRYICELEWNKLKNAGYLFLWFQRCALLGALCRLMISTGLRLFPLLRLLPSAPRSRGTGAVRGDNPSGLHRGSARQNGMGSTYHHPKKGDGPRELSGPGIRSRTAPPLWPLWGEMKEGSWESC